MDINQQRKEALINLLREDDMSLSDADNFLNRLRRLDFLDSEWKLKPESFEPLEDKDELKKIPTEMDKLQHIDKEVLGVINAYTGLTREIIQLAFQESEEDKVRKSLDNLVRKDLIFTSNSGYYPTLVSE